MSGCICNRGAKSTGRPKCVTVRGITRQLALGDWKNDSGNINSFPQGTTIDQTYVEALLNNSNKTERLYILPKVKRVTHDRAEEVTEDVGGGILKNTGEQGVRLHTYEILGKDATEEMLAAIKSFQCGTIGFHEFTHTGQITGTNTGDGDLKRTKIEDDTLKVRIMYSQEGVIQKIMISFMVDESEIDEEQDYILADSIDYHVRYWYDSQPQQVEIIEVESTSLTEIKVKLVWARLRYENDGIEDFVANDFNAGGGAATIKNLTQSTDPSVTVTESNLPDEQGVYTLTFAAQNDQDLVEVGIIKDGYDAINLRVYVGPTS